MRRLQYLMSVCSYLSREIEGLNRSTKRGAGQSLKNRFFYASKKRDRILAKAVKNASEVNILGHPVSLY